nr:hypothetical protein [Oryza glaberrima]
MKGATKLGTAAGRGRDDGGWSRRCRGRRQAELGAAERALARRRRSRRRQSEPRMAAGGAREAEEAPTATVARLVEAMEPSVVVGARAATAGI